MNALYTILPYLDNGIIKLKKERGTIMKVCNFGSLNFDKVYAMEHFVEPKETISSIGYMENFGGKGLNQSIALAKAGEEVYHAGKVGKDGQPFIDYLEKYGVHTDYLKKDDNTVTGHAIIQTCKGENCIILFGGANQEIDEKLADEVLSHFEKGDVLLLQNEISSMAYIMKKAHETGMKIVFNTAPMDAKVFTYPLELVDLFIVNEVEGRGLAKVDSKCYEDIIAGLQKAYPDTEIVLTCGGDGSYYIHGNEVVHQEAFMVDAVDTTAAGDTFTGYFLACQMMEMSVQDSLKVASKASSVTVQGHGAAQSIPEWKEVAGALIP